MKLNIGLGREKLLGFKTLDMGETVNPVIFC